MDVLADLAELEENDGFVRRHIGPSESELAAMLQVKMFIVAALVDAVAMIGIGFALFFTFANPFTTGLTH